VELAVRPADVEELTEGPPLDVALENAYRKAAAISRGSITGKAGGPILGVDTLVAVGRRILGKPRDEGHARETLGLLAGREHVAISGVCVIDSRGTRTAAASTTVCFRAATPELLDWYLATEEWRDRAGGYAIQGRGAALVERIEGDYTNVVGLPVPALLDVLPDLLAFP